MSERFQERREATHVMTQHAYHEFTFGHENAAHPDLPTRDARDYVGGMWEEMGRLQLDFLRRMGLEPGHRFLDVGCGSFRAGRHLVDYLDPGNYYGIDINHEIIEVGYDRELTDDQRARLPVDNLHSTDRFDCTFGDTRFDFAIAQSVFTHVSLNVARLCLHRLGQVMVPGGRFYATFFERPLTEPIDAATDRHFSERDIFWNYREDLRFIARHTPWAFRYIGGWGHPRDQRMIEYTRLTDEEFAAKRPGRRRADREA